MKLKQCLVTIFLISACSTLFAQNAQQPASGENEIIKTDKKKLAAATDDTTKSELMGGLGLLYESINTDSSLKYGMASLHFAEKSGNKHYETRALAGLSGVLRQQGKFAEALDVLFKSLKIAQEYNLQEDIGRSYRRLGLVYFELENYSKAVEYGRKALDIDDKLQLRTKSQIDHVELANDFERLNSLDSALVHAMLGKDIVDVFKPAFNEVLGDIYLKKNNYPLAYSFYRKSYDTCLLVNDFGTAAEACNGLTDLYLKLNNKDSAIYYAKKGFAFGQKSSFKKGIIKAANTLAEIYDSTQPALALMYLKVATATRDSLFGASTIQTIQNLISQEQARQNELEDAKAAYKNRLTWYAVITVLIVVLIIVIIQYRNNKQKLRSNIILQQQKQQVETTLSELKSTQAQLIQSEKMASLGELTAGIAHEIQNPLNFVNNFSEVNKEMIDEATEEIDKGNITEVKNILNDIKDNSEKINHHGKRADSIVKGMLQHSRQTKGMKESTDINALCDEYLRLSFHGLRAKDKNFNADFTTDFDETIGKINIVPQDVGRVLLNLFNNAFYAVNEKLKAESSKLNADYKPLVSIQTKKTNNKIEIRVSDNGNGIPQSIIDKIFQPFFTTKPTGEGTGLGLSLAYDIITKEHNGTIKAESREGEGTMFIIQLPTTIQ